MKTKQIVCLFVIGLLVDPHARPADRDARHLFLRGQHVPFAPAGDRPPLPCVEACTPGAITHSW